MSDYSMPVVIAAPRSGKNVVPSNCTPRMEAQESEVTYWAVRVTEYRRKTVFATLLSFLLVVTLSVCVVSDFL
jgi:hypothetical protein